MQSANMLCEPPNPKKSEMHPPEQHYTPMAETVAVADQVVDTEVDEETYARSTKAQTVKWTIIPPKHAEKVNPLKTTMAIQKPPGTMNELATTAVCQDNSNPTASTSNVPGINTTMSTRALHR
jgi:hypothetical protein